MKKLHKTQKQILDILKKRIGEPLTIRDLQYELNLSSPSLVHHHIIQLEKKGYLKRNPSNPADFQILSDTDNVITYLNLYGIAKCGTNGTILDGNPIDRLPIATKLLKFPSEEAFLIEASGDSMEPKIPDNAIVIAQKINTIIENSIMVCCYQRMAYIKKIMKKNNRIYLKSLNNKYPDILIKDDSLKIEGLVKGILSYT